MYFLTLVGASYLTIIKRPPSKNKELTLRFNCSTLFYFSPIKSNREATDSKLINKNDFVYLYNVDSRRFEFIISNYARFIDAGVSSPH